MVLTKKDKEIINDLKGDEVYFNEEIVGIEYPYVWKIGKRKKLSDENWKELIKQYFESNLNEGYWDMRSF